MEILSVRARAYRSSLYFRNKFLVITWETISVEAIKLLVNNGTVEKITDNPFFFWFDFSRLSSFHVLAEKIQLAEELKKDGEREPASISSEFRSSSR